ncbi:hypothetical protein NEF87_000317 [Candidatus Lokiarchaeum ossiferum]|uniref:DUF599 domain-containing protein n=1 Tax=Candidatus Lokiarchaeum ossiferum TaxID=2951803 RepID=A0ABY6HNQ1_9ARCH|nr:hypothetical protein NEF87_000317 [Candidatus Lokiarchaeum sp. B-35]
MIHELAIITFIVCIATYFVFFYLNKIKRNPSQRNVMRLIYANWVEERLNDDSVLTGVQALRNFMMGNSSFISALFILLGLLVGFYSGGFLDETVIFNSLTTGLVQISSIIVVISYCLVNFILSLRFITRLSLLITGNPRKYSIKKIEGINIAKRTFISAQNHWMLGVRGLFFMIATLLWLVNPILFIISSVLITVYLIGFHDFWSLLKQNPE